MNENIRFCQCKEGCQEVVLSQNKIYAKGHNPKCAHYNKTAWNKKQDHNYFPYFCECGCGEICKQGARYALGHHNRIRTEENEKRLQLARKNIVGPFWNKGLTKNTDERLKYVSEFNSKWNLEHSDWLSEKVRRQHGNFSGVSNFEPYGIEFNKALKEQIRQRDNYQCRECGYFQKDLGYKLNVHHIDYNKKNNSPLNLISLCRSCHMKTNYGKDNWIDYYNEKVSS